MKIYPVKPHKRTILSYYKTPLYINIPESSFVVKDNRIYYGIIKNDCLIATNLGFYLNCGGWIYDIKNDKDLINKFWNATFPTFIINKIKKSKYNVELDITSGLIPFHNNEDDVVNLVNCELNKSKKNKLIIYNLFKYPFVEINLNFGNKTEFIYNIVNKLCKIYS